MSHERWSIRSDWHLGFGEGEGYRNRERGFRVGFVEKFDYGRREKERASGLLVEKILATYYYYYYF